MEHLMGCRAKNRPCEISFCTFHGNSKQIEVHNRNAMTHHNALLFKAHEELIQQIKLKVTLMFSDIRICSVIFRLFISII
jgi:hypothetical protein